MAGVIDPASSTSCVSFRLLPVPSAHPSGPAWVLPTPKAFVDAMALRASPHPRVLLPWSQGGPQGRRAPPSSLRLALLLKHLIWLPCQQGFRKRPLQGTWRNQRGVTALPLSSGPSSALGLEE